MSIEKELSDLREITEEFTRVTNWAKELRDQEISKGKKLRFELDNMPRNSKGGRKSVSPTVPPRGKMTDEMVEEKPPEDPKPPQTLSLDARKDISEIQKFLNTLSAEQNKLKDVVVTMKATLDTCVGQIDALRKQQGASRSTSVPRPLSSDRPKRLGPQL